MAERMLFGHFFKCQLATDGSFLFFKHAKMGGQSVTSSLKISEASTLTKVLA
jgi:hypothetical protein